jgi:hypothetical protein
MNEKNPSIALREVEAKLVGRAWEDEAFKQALLNDPCAAIEQATGLKLPAGLDVKVLEETSDTLYLVVPVNPLGQALEEGELSDETLAVVAGGGNVPTAPGYPHPLCKP